MRNVFVLDVSVWSASLQCVWASPFSTHMLLMLSSCVLERPFWPWPPWPSVPPPSEGGSMRWNINGVRFCVRYTTWPAGLHQAHSGGRHRTQTQDALAACTHTGAPSASTWLWVSKVKFPQRLLDLESACYPESVKGTLLTLICWVEIQGSKTDLRSVSEGSFYLEVRLLLNLRSWTRFSYSQNISI